MVLHQFDYDSAKSSILNLKCDELKTLLLIDNLSLSGLRLKADLQKRCLAHLESSHKSDNFLNAINAVRLAQAQAQNESKLKKNFMVHFS